MQAKSFDAPIKLLFPRALEEGDTSTPFSMLGLGDIVIPGIFVALILRYDALHASKYFRRCGSCLLTALVFSPVMRGCLLLILRYNAMHTSKNVRRCSSCLFATLTILSCDSEVVHCETCVFPACSGVLSYDICKAVNSSIPLLHSLSVSHMPTCFA